ncbi:HNH endonuclease [Nonomuraea sp. NPDC050404]|uniref:HNH endonuclease n=1 Tax=Nonomuraea sp. NPDC050404 TaxID=3155783 RepID=UPI0033FD6237
MTMTIERLGEQLARIRTIKPDFWDDDAVGALSRDARLMFIATWNLADDEGLVRWTAAYLKAHVFMYDDDITTADVEALMQELVERDMVFPYVAGKARQKLAYVVNFRKHQRINRPQPSKLAPPSIQSGDVLQMYVRRDKGVCHLCKFEVTTEHDQPRLWPSLDHLTPRVQGGSDYPSNIALSHTSCNKSRRDRPTEDFKSSPGSRSLSDSLNGAVNDVVNESGNGARSDSLPEGKGREGKGKVDLPAVGGLTDRNARTSGEAPPAQAGRSSTATSLTARSLIAAIPRYRDPALKPWFRRHLIEMADVALAAGFHRDAIAYYAGMVIDERSFAEHQHIREFRHALRRLSQDVGNGHACRRCAGDPTAGLCCVPDTDRAWTDDDQAALERALDALRPTDDELAQEA